MGGPAEVGGEARSVGEGGVWLGRFRGEAAGARGSLDGAGSWTAGQQARREAGALNEAREPLRPGSALLCSAAGRCLWEGEAPGEVGAASRAARAPRGVGQAESGSAVWTELVVGADAPAGAAGAVRRGVLIRAGRSCPPKGC